MGFLKFLFYAIIILTIVRFVMARIFPWLLRKFFQKIQKRAYDQFNAQNANNGQGNPSQSKKPDGKIHIDYIPPESKPNKGADKAGEFVDFEEIK